MTTLHNQTIELRNDRREIVALSAWVDRFAGEIALSSVRRGELQVALEEVATNVIKHGYGEGGQRRFTVTLAADEDFVCAEVIDDAPAYDPLARAEIETDLPLEDRAIGGLGVHMVKHLMASVKYERRGAQNVLTLHCHRKDNAKPDSDNSLLASGA